MVGTIGNTGDISSTGGVGGPRGIGNTGDISSTGGVGGPAGSKIQADHQLLASAANQIPADFKTSPKEEASSSQSISGYPPLDQQAVKTLGDVLKNLG